MQRVCGVPSLGGLSWVNVSSSCWHVGYSCRYRASWPYLAFPGLDSKSSPAAASHSTGFPPRASVRHPHSTETPVTLRLFVEGQKGQKAVQGLSLHHADYSAQHRLIDAAISAVLQGAADPISLGEARDSLGRWRLMRAPLTNRSRLSSINLEDGEHKVSLRLTGLSLSLALFHTHTLDSIPFHKVLSFPPLP